jgi:VIT1/CCC1 family predicted Fe2+/Mn2+ transporter
MSWRAILLSPRGRLDIFAGLVDGILNALTLAAGRILRSGDGADFQLALRVAIATGLTTVFVFFIAHYAELRAELVRAEQELNLLSHGRLATSQLGRRALESAASGAVLAAICGVIGAMVPLLICAYAPGPRWIGLGAILLLLAALGGLLARSFHGSVAFWSVSIAIAGAVLGYVGLQINIVG